MISHPLTADLLTYFDGKLTEEKKAKVFKHLLKCQVCFKELAKMAYPENPEKLEQLRKEIDDMKNKKKARIKKLFFILCMLAIIGFFAAGTFPHSVSIFFFGVLSFSFGYFWGKEHGIEQGAKEQRKFDEEFT